MDRNTIVARAEALPPVYFRDKQPQTLMITPYSAGQSIVAAGSKSIYTLPDFWLACLCWYFEGDDDLNKQLIYEPFAPHGIPKVLFVPHDKCESAWQNHAKSFVRYCGLSAFRNLYVMDDTWNDYLLLGETEKQWYFFRWWTGE